MKTFLGRFFTLSTLVVLVTGMAVWPADSAGLRCRSDPAVLLSDGTVLDLSADIAAPLWDVVSVDYVIHVPARAKVVAVIPTPSWPTTVERATVITDMPDGVYDTRTVVRTRHHDVAVTANLIVKPLLGWLRLASTNGRTEQPLRVVIRTR